MAGFVQPAHANDLAAIEQRTGHLIREAGRGQFVVIDLARQVQQHVLIVEQLLMDLLMNQAEVALDRLLLAHDFLVAQVPKGRRDGREE